MSEESELVAEKLVGEVGEPFQGCPRDKYGHYMVKFPHSEELFFDVDPSKPPIEGLPLEFVVLSSPTENGPKIPKQVYGVRVQGGPVYYDMVGHPGKRYILEQLSEATHKRARALLYPS